MAFEPPGLSPVRYLESLGALAPGLVAAHCVRVDGTDRALLARRGVSVALCPRSNRNLGVGLPPLPDLLADGVRLCLGTDSLASAESLDLAPGRRPAAPHLSGSGPRRARAHGDRGRR